LKLLTPHTADELADAIRGACADGQPLVPWGAGTLQRLGAAPPPTALALGTGALGRVIDYNPPDLAITVEAGIALDVLQATLGQHGQWLPWCPPAAGAATVGGLLAAGAGGPLRLGYGAPRDWVLGMRVALGDGRLVKSGGKVVKNVAGYEAHKLHIGALGTLGVIVEVTFKVFPLPERTGALLAACAARADALALLRRWREWPLAPASLALLGGGAVELLAGYTAGARAHTLLAVRFDGVPAAVERQRIAAAGAARPHSLAVADLGDEQTRAAWQDIGALFSPGPSPASGGAEPTGLLIRAGARPAALPALLEALERHAPPGTRPQVLGYGGVGLAYARWPLADGLDATATTRALAALRAELAAEGGYAVVEDAPDELRAGLDLWGPPPATLPLMRALKAQWDPRGILNPGRYVGGI
jgi:glycolate oxidase FAD binding subunit